MRFYVSGLCLLLSACGAPHSFVPDEQKWAADRGGAACGSRYNLDAPPLGSSSMRTFRCLHENAEHERHLRAAGMPPSLAAQMRLIPEGHLLKRRRK